MNLKDLNDFVEEWDAYLLKRTGHSDREHKFARTVKLTEEVGELASEILSAEGDQRKEKLEGKKREDLEHEFADVLITLFLLAKSYDIDMEEVTSRKMAHIRAKGKEV